MPAVTSQLPGNGTSSITFTIPGNGLDVETVYAEIDATAAGGNVTAELTIADQSGVVIARKAQGTVIDFGATGSATWALRLDEEAASGSTPYTPPTEQEQFNGPDLTITAGNGGTLRFAYFAGATLVSLANTQAPKILTAGIYSLTVNVQTRENVNAGRRVGFFGSFNGATGGDQMNAAYVAETGGGVMVESRHITSYVAVNDTFSVSVANLDTITHNFFVRAATLQRIT